MLSSRPAFWIARPSISAALLLHFLGSPAMASEDALSLESAPVENVENFNKPKFFIEGAVGNAARRFGSSLDDTGRLSFDFSYAGKLSPEWRLVFSNRLDLVHPAPAPGVDTTVNSLREAYVSWQPAAGNTSFDFGRINVRSGPGYGYNPTDFFRDGSLRVVTTADPFALRQNRLGSVMLRAQQLWDGGSLSFAYSPDLANRPSASGWSTDLGSTNNRQRGLVTLGTRISEGVNTQLLLYKEEGRQAALGASLTALVSDAAVVHLEWSRSREPDLLSRAIGGPANAMTRSRFVGGLSYTTVGKTTITAEYQYNGFGLAERRWAALAANPLAQLAYLRESLRLLELAPRQALLLYVTQKGLWLKDLDFTAYVRFNLEDSSKLAWFEFRHHWTNFDLTVQWQQNIGRGGTEFGLLPERRALQILGTFYF